MKLEQTITFEVVRSRVCRWVSVILNGAGEESGEFVGRTCGDVRDVETVILLSDDIAPGEITRACVTGSRKCDLAGVV